MSSRLSGFALSLALLAVASPVLAGPRWNMDTNTWMQLSFLGQVHASYLEDAADAEDFYLRRGRIILSGQIMDGVQFFAETDNDNAGKNGVDDASTDLQDAFVDVRLGESKHWAKAGLILLPFSFESRSSAGSLLGLDYNLETIKLANTFVWRDYGVELHGSTCPFFSYAVGVFDGYDSKSGIKNPDAGLRFTGHVAMNFIGEVETGWFYTQDRLGKAGPYLSLGLGGDYQEKATKTVGAADALTGVPPPPVVEDATAWVVDVQSGWAMGPVLQTLNAACYVWDHALFDGETAFVETGLRVARTMLTLKATTQRPDQGDRIDDFTAGLHYFLKDHHARFGIEYRSGDSPDQVLAGLQFLL